MKRNPKKYLNDMLDACQFVSEMISECTLEGLKTDRVLRNAVERQLQNAGEALRQLHQSFPHIAAQIRDYERIIRFRHVLVHGYDVVKPEVVWNIIEFHLKDLREDVDSLLGSL